MLANSRVIVITVAALLALGVPASAEDRAKAREAFRRGNQHYNLGEYQPALDAFKEAYRNFEDPTFLFNIGQCERQLDKRTDAIRAYRMYLLNAHDAANRDEVRQLIARLERELSEERATKAAPPPGVIAPPPSSASAPAPPPATVSTAPSPLIVRAAAPRRHETPGYKKWWVWTLVGGVVVGGVAAGLAVGLTRNPSSPSVNATFGTAHPF